MKVCRRREGEEGSERRRERTDASPKNKRKGIVLGFWGVKGKEEGRWELFVPVVGLEVCVCMCVRVGTSECGRGG